MLSKERWFAIIFAAVVSEAVPYKQIWYSPKFQSFLAWEIRELPASQLPYLLALVPAFEVLVLLVAFGAYLGATRSFGLRGFLKGLWAAVLLFAFAFSVVMPLSLVLLSVVTYWVAWPLLPMSPPRHFQDDIGPIFFYYGVWRLPLFISLVLGIFVARKASTTQIQKPRCA